MSATHPYVSAIADGGDGTLVQPSNWNAAHAGIQDDDADPGVDQVVRAAHCAHLIGLPLIIESGRLVDVNAGAVLVLQP